MDIPGRVGPAPAGSVDPVPPHVALLRGIAPSNPKMHNAELRRVFEAAGFDHVRTVISSGNVLFDADETDRAVIEQRIEAALETHLGTHCSAIVRSRRQIALLAGLDVFDDYDDTPAQRCNVTFLQRAPSTPLPEFEPEPGATVVAVRSQAVFTVIDTTRAGTPRLMRDLERSFGRAITMRTWRTVHRILDAFDT